MSPHPTPYSEAEVRSLLDRDEGQFLEFKSAWNLKGSRKSRIKRRVIRDKIAECVAAFANADGGVLLIGVNDNGTPTGHGYPEEAVGEFFAVPRARLQPPVKCSTGRIFLDDQEILIFDVPNTPQAVMVTGDGFPYRVGDQTIYEPQEVINARKDAYRRVGFEQRIRPDASLDNLDLDLAQQFISTGVFSGRPVDEVLERYGLIHHLRADWKVTNAALLLFAKPPVTRWHPRAGIRFFRVAGTERTHGQRRNVIQLPRVEEPIARAVEEAHRLARSQIRRSEHLHNLFFKETPEYPEFAWQEAIINAVAHRDYENQSREIEVWFYDDRMEIQSPGGLVPPVTLEALRTRRPAHASRNPLIVRVLADVGIMRDEGEGVPRIFEEMEASFLHPPRLNVEGDVFTVTLFNEPVFSGPSEEWKKIVDGLPVRLSQKRVLLAHPDGFSNEDFRELSGVNRDEAYREIQEMVTLGVVSPAETPGRGAVYRISPDLRESRAFLEKRLPQLREFFESRPWLRNADYRETFQLSRKQALKELKRLVEMGWLRLEGERRGARYLPGRLLTDNAL